MMRRLLRTDGTSVELPNKLTMRQIAELIGAETLDSVNLRHMGHPLHVMVIDDGGYEFAVNQLSPVHTELQPLRALKPVNLEATRLYHLNCKPGTTHRIVGDVVVVPDDDFE